MMFSNDSHVRFRHLADLHLASSCSGCDAGLCGRERPCSVAIKGNIIYGYKDGDSGELHIVHAPQRPWFYVDAKLSATRLVALNTGALKATFEY